MSVPYLPAERVTAQDNIRRCDDNVGYWKRLGQLSVFQEPSSVTSIAFCPRKPYSVASTSSVRLSLYDTVVCEPINLFSRFKQAVYGVKFRNDGQLIAIGGEEGKVRIFDVDRGSGMGKAPLRSTRASQSCVRAVDFAATGKTLYSMADDGVVKQWDIADTSSKPILEFSAHSDAIRASTVSSTNDHLLLTGGYDHKVKLWDTRCASKGATVQLDTGFPVESVLLLTNEHVVATAAGSIIKIWDLSAGGRQLISLQFHHKTVTSLCLGAHGGALLSGAIDRRINIFNIADFSLIHSMSLAAPVLGLAMSPDDNTLAIGMGSLLAIHRRAPAKKAIVSTNIHDKRSLVRVAAPKVQIREKGKVMKTIEITAKSNDQLRLSKIDSLLKGYQHGAAIHKMFQSFYANNKQENVIGWLKVIVHRRAIHRALAGQNPDVQLNILKFLNQQMFRNNNFEILHHVADAFYEVYADEVVDERVYRWITNLKSAVARELSIQKQLCQTIGALEFIINSGRIITSPKDYSNTDVFGEPTLTSIPLDLSDSTTSNTI